MRISLIVLTLFTIPGCGSGTPDAATVKQHMDSDQLALGDPIVNSVGIVLVPIPPGEFQMGTPKPKEMDWNDIKRRIEDAVESGKITREQAEAKYKELKEQNSRSEQRGKDKPGTSQHLVRITKPYYLSVCEVTQQQYEKVMGTRPWRGKPLIEEGPSYAASYVSWNNAAEFCRKLSEKESAAHRLPTEAEWEYACRSGTQTTWHFGDDGGQLADYAWYDANAYKAGEQYPHQAARKLPNAWALYDMHGNVWEWCQDWYGPYDVKKKESADPKGPEEGRFRVWRGGSFATAMENTRAATRLDHDREEYRPEYLAGFRVVREFE